MKDPDRRSWIRRAAPAVFLLSGVFLLIDATILEPNWIVARRSIEYLPALSARSPDLMVAHLGDLHVARMGWN